MTSANPAGEDDAVIFIVEDDVPFRDALARLFRTVGLKTEVFASARDFLDTNLPNCPCCLVLDVRLPGLSGLDLQTELQKRDIRIPIIIMTGHGDIPMSVRAMKAGAIDFLAKPFRDQDLLDAVGAALESDRAQRNVDLLHTDLRTRYEALTPREREVMALVTKGLMNKNVAHELGLSEITVKIRRGAVMKKMGAKSLPDLVRMAEALSIKP